MKLVQISFRFEYTEMIERILDRHDLTDFVRHAMIQGRDCDGKHYGSQVFPGNMVVVQAQVPPDNIDALLDDLQRFREEKPAHRHLQALVLPIERRL